MNLQDREALSTAFLATTYVATGPAGAEIRIRVGARHPDLDSLLLEQDAVCWAFLTPCNPRSQSLPDDVNAARVEALRGELGEQGYLFWEGAGMGEGTDWPPEPSLLAFGIPRNEATAIAERYGQYAFVFGDLNGPAELVWTAVQAL